MYKEWTKVTFFAQPRAGEDEGGLRGGLMVAYSSSYGMEGQC